MSASSKRLSRALKSGVSPIAGMGAMSRKALATRNGPKASETDHLQTSQFPSGGRHHGPSADSAKKNAAAGSGGLSAPSTGRHSLSNGQVGRRASYSRERDVAGAYKDSVGTGYTGKHRATSNVTSVKKNNSGDLTAKATGKRTRYSESGDKHRANTPARAEESNYMHDLKGAVKAHQGTGYVGKHRKPGA